MQQKNKMDHANVQLKLRSFKRSKKIKKIKWKQQKVYVIGITIKPQKNDLLNHMKESNERTNDNE